MVIRYSFVTAGRQTDYSDFWKFFDNYMVSAEDNDHLDEQVMGWYLTDDYHHDFYKRIFDPDSGAKLLLLYRREERETEEKGRQGLFSGLLRSRERQSKDYLDRHRIRSERSAGRCVGFLLLEWDGSPSSAAWILALSLEGLKEQNTEKMQLWTELEKTLRRFGIRELETASYQKPRFWKSNGFVQKGLHTLSKSI